MFSNFVICATDSEILKAFTIVEDITKEFQLVNPVQTKFSLETENFVDNIEGSKSVSLITNTNTLDFADLCKTSRLESEREDVAEDVKQIYLMHDLFIEKQSTAREDTNSFIQSSFTAAQEIMSSSILDKRLQKINSVNSHIFAIKKQMCHIKQTLQDTPWKDTLKVTPSCQRDVINFFHTTTELLKKMQENSDHFESVEKNKMTKITPVNNKALQSLLQSIIFTLTRSVDLTTEFRRYLFTQKGSESEFESSVKNSESSHGGLSIASVDSGLHSSDSYNQFCGV